MNKIFTGDDPESNKHRAEMIGVILNVVLAIVTLKAIQSGGGNAANIIAESLPEAAASASGSLGAFLNSAEF